MLIMFQPSYLFKDSVLTIVTIFYSSDEAETQKLLYRRAISHMMVNGPGNFLLFKLKY